MARVGGLEKASFLAAAPLWVSTSLLSEPEDAQLRSGPAGLAGRGLVRQMSPLCLLALTSPGREVPPGWESLHESWGAPLGLLPPGWSRSDHQFLQGSMYPDSIPGTPAAGPLDPYPPPPLRPLEHPPGCPGHCPAGGGLSPIHRLSCTNDQTPTSLASCHHPGPTSPPRGQATTACCPTR